MIGVFILNWRGKVVINLSLRILKVRKYDVEDVNYRQGIYYLNGSWIWETLE